MKVARVLAGIFAAAGVILLLGTIGVCLVNRDAPARVAYVPEGAIQCSQDVMDRLAAGDFTGVSQKIYGQPELGLSQTLDDGVSNRFWQAYRENICWQFQSACYATDTGFARQVQVTTLDLPAMVLDMQQRSHDRMRQRVEAATEMEQLYDEQNNFRQDLIEEVMEQAISEALQEKKTVDYQITLNLVNRDGQWWIVGDPQLLSVLSGGVE